MEPIYLLRHLENQYKTLMTQCQVFHNKSKNDRVAVIMEPRRHPLLTKIIRNFMYHLGEDWNIHIFTSMKNMEWIADQLKGCFLRITPLDQENLTIPEYSALLMDPSFWEKIPEEHILIFQTDCILFRNGVDLWIDPYDYVGANYYNPHHTAPEIGGIQGGLSLRKKSVMIECINRVTITDINTYRLKKGYKPIMEKEMAEDIFFTHACEILKKKVPSIEKRREFSIEADYHPRALGHHGLKYSYLSAEQQKELLSNP